MTQNNILYIDVLDACVVQSRGSTDPKTMVETGKVEEEEHNLVRRDDNQSKNPIKLYSKMTGKSLVSCRSSGSGVVAAGLTSSSSL